MNWSSLRSLTFGSLASAVLLSHVAPSAAHHSEEVYDREETITLAGVVREFQYVNPHSWLIVEVTSEDGSVVTWGFEGDPPLRLMSAVGVRKGDLPPGTKVTITAHPLRDGRPAGRWIQIVRDDGTQFSASTPRDVAYQ